MDAVAIVRADRDVVEASQQLLRRPDHRPLHLFEGFVEQAAREEQLDCRKELAVELQALDRQMDGRHHELGQLLGRAVAIALCSGRMDFSRTRYASAA